MKINIASNEVIHFIGIGGIGMSGLAQIMKNMGFAIQGSDLNKNKNTERLVKSGIKVFLKHDKKNLKNVTKIVISSAIKNNNKELKVARDKKLPIFKRGDMLANIVALKKNIIITGSHGKTTTTSLVANILLEAGLDPTIINGGIINSFKNNAQLGKSEWAVIESDESDGSFLKLPVTYSIVTNVDKEHLEYYGNFEKLKNSFIKFIDKTPSFGKSFICIDNQNLKSLVKRCKNNNYLTYGFNKNSNYQIENVKKNKNNSIFDLKIKIVDRKNFKIKNLKINLLGDHNISNVAASIAIALNLGIKINKIKKSLRKFLGIQRRFTKVFSIGKKDFFDDYAHHPTEIKAVINGAREVYKNRKIICVFQPHRYSRVAALKKEFASSFKSIDSVVLCPVYSAGEKKKYNFNQDRFSKLISKKSNTQVINIKNQKDLKNFFNKNLLSDEMVICMGAGSITNWIREIGNDLK
ncbi:UDP-N-acetylmuramate--L-alanine ligase [Pelagibacteraceae bacterium]|nr:UDP-N-acetylmuramate--L-alanine ligase [Pelagibacteraceae bacterium]|tara:strand:- start:1077 stop:2474 length:1398 start_codon:yes stop_codon:yes gene_type:complete